MIESRYSPFENMKVSTGTLQKDDEKNGCIEFIVKYISTYVEVIAMRNYEGVRCEMSFENTPHMWWYVRYYNVACI